MSWRTNPEIIALRNLGRSLGLNRIFARMMATGNYEDKFHEQMLSHIQAGDCVWDIGANIGLYSVEFAARVGLTGEVYAIEPSTLNRTRLESAVGGLKNVTIIPVALGAEEKHVAFHQGIDSEGATSRIVENATNERVDLMSVEMYRADDLVRASKIKDPHIVKIDTEGFELDVLTGMDQVLKSQKLRAVCIEVHFGLLADRGKKDAPSEIEQILSKNGFSISWPDSSHIIASRFAS